MISVQEAENIILSRAKDYGLEYVSFEDANGRVLAEDITADRDLPPCDRSTMDGIALKYASFLSGTKTFRIRGTQAAGDMPISVEAPGECIEIMTGGALHQSMDTIVRYEDVAIKEGTATINVAAIKQGQSIHAKGKDRRQGAVVVKAATSVDATVISMAASVGRAALPVKKLPRVVIITTGDELVDVNMQPEPWQFRSSNDHTIKSVLKQHGIRADLLHLSDDPDTLNQKIGDSLKDYDVLLLSGGVSMGKFDHLPQVLEELGVKKHFHKVAQRPGKPFWFGEHESETLVFAFPGNPVSAFMCLHRYFIPWLHQSLGQIPNSISQTPTYAILSRDVTFSPPLQYFMQVSVSANRYGQLMATPAEGNGSGDFANLVDSNAFMELPLEESNFIKRGVYRIWPFKNIVA